ncbi:hypothetical protein OPQ81_010715 [Rhizoctonia solani]|nr:hypothetical protein OPQ81_010715 [Rhizoctonia solani]
MRYMTAVLVGVWTETALWCIFFVLYLTCVRVLVRKRTLQTIQWIPLCTASLLFILATFHLALQLRKVYEGLVLCANKPGGSDAYFTNLDHWLNIVADGVYVTMILSSCNHTPSNTRSLHGSLRLPCSLALHQATTSWYSTRGAACKVCDYNLSSFAYHELSTSVDIRPYLGGLTVVVESAAIYTTALVIYLVVYISRSNAQYILFCTLCPIIGIVPTLIIVRVGLGLTRTCQVDVEGPPSTPSPTCDIYPPIDPPTLRITHIVPSYSPWPSSPHTRDFSGSDTAWVEGPDAIHLQLRYSQGSVGRSIALDDISRNSSASFGLVNLRILYLHCLYQYMITRFGGGKAIIIK